MKKTLLFLSAAGCALPALANPVTYDIAFTGGFHTNTPPYFMEYAPQSGSFTYDSASGFSSFTALWGIETFDFTSSANVDPEAVFTLLTTGNQWNATELGGCCNIVQTSIYIANASASVPADPSGSTNFTGAIAIQGTYSLTETPEPATLGILSAAALGFLCFSRLRLRSLPRN